MQRTGQDESAFGGLNHLAFEPLRVRKPRPSEMAKTKEKSVVKAKGAVKTRGAVTGGSPFGRVKSIQPIAHVPVLKVRRVRMRTLDPKVIRAFIRENCDLIKTVPKDLVPGIERRIKRIYEGTSTPETLTRYLENTCDLEDWQAARIVRDQMQKYEARARLESFRKAGVKTVRWVHGDSHEPRPWHVHKWPYGLNGFEFDIDNPPVIDPATGETGYPGQLIGCKCHLEAVE